MKLKCDIEHEFVIKGSRFICYLHRVESEAEAREFIAKIKKLHPDATHHCSAFVCNHQMAQRSSDDGEPSGTAGVPMLESIRKSGLEDVVSVVVRYFGGVKLGAGGLIRAYSSAVSEAIHHAAKVQIEKVQCYRLDYPYDLSGKLDYYLQSNTTVTNQIYDLEIHTEFYCLKDLTAEIQELTSGKALPLYLGEKEIEVELQ